jgi:hypothetical protein
MATSDPINQALRRAAGRAPDPAELPYGPRPATPAHLTGRALAIWTDAMDEMDAANAAAMGHVPRRGHGSADGAARGAAPSAAVDFNRILRDAARVSRLMGD